MRFRIAIQHERKNIRLNVERTFKSNQLERFQVTARNKSLTLQSNRPLLIAKGLKNKKPVYTLMTGSIHNAYILNEIISAIQRYIKQFSE